MKRTDDIGNMGDRVKVDEFGQIADSTIPEYGLSREQINEGISKRVSEEFTRLPPCENWWGEGSFHHSSIGDDYECTYNSRDPSNLSEYLAREGFDVARDWNNLVFYIKKSNSSYIVFDGCLEVGGFGPHTEEITDLIRNFHSYEDISKWEGKSIKYMEEGLSVVDQHGNRVTLSDRYDELYSGEFDL